MKKIKYDTMWKVSFLFFAVILLWQIVSSLKIIDSFLFPSPSSVIGSASLMFRTGELQKNIIVTLERFFLGLFFGCSFGLIIGFCYGTSRKIFIFLEPLIYLIYPIPRFVLLPFILLFFGTGMLSKIIFIGMGAFFPTVINTIGGIRQINGSFLELARHYGARGQKLFRRVILPASLPYIFVGLRISVGLTLTYVIIIEFLYANDGLGAMMWMSLQTLRIDRLFLGAGIIALFNIIAIFLLKIVESFFTPWNHEEEEKSFI